MPIILSRWNIFCLYNLFLWRVISDKRVGTHGRFAAVYFSFLILVLWNWIANKFSHHNQTLFPYACYISSLSQPSEVPEKYKPRGSSFQSSVLRHFSIQAALSLGFSGKLFSKFPKFVSTFLGPLGRETSLYLHSTHTTTQKHAHDMLKVEFEPAVRMIARPLRRVSCIKFVQNTVRLLHTVCERLALNDVAQETCCVMLGR